ncbi:site-specific recombinase XerD [Halobacteroides halobius DSM 5150]|uniref:Site-specific recombinase XerD n=1 Tax=Halobacteroides halobius (strain ATCC 35273 / DSM 5150 / MD-1) TaxID=748449 RepID=L0KBX9_HALHC|nr:tyrosine-type recombinase/integrase [Halobacteroides halobius]AGB42060.1 site-specific recombinase XerD [Halobacteroides halobius DSM 5150]
MAHLRKRGQNSWQICIEKGRDPITGKRNRIYKTVNGTKKEAEKEMHKLAHEVETGAYIEPSEMTVKEFLLQWFEDYCESNLAPSTLESYEIIIKSHLIPALGDIKVSDLEPMHIKRYQTHKLKNGRRDGKEGGLSKRTVQYHHRVLSKALKHAVKWRIIDNNPAEVIEAPSPDTPEIKALTHDQTKRLLNVAKDWIHDIIYIALYTGMRRSEVLALRWQDIDFKEQKLQVKQAVTNPVGKGLIFRKPKTDSSIRPIDVDEDIIEILKRRKKEQQENQLKFGDKYNNEYNLVFCKPTGEPMRPQTVTRNFNRVAKKAELSQFRLHDLRHTHATLMLQAGVHPKIVQERLGHSTISQTLDTYSHVIPSMQKEAVQKLKNSLENK